MSALFADTSFFVAFLNPRDGAHQAAFGYMASSPQPLLTTTWVLAELGNFLARGPNRRLFAPFVRRLKAEPRVRIKPADEALFQKGLRLYASRPDKEWSITDCTSFVVMREEGLREALTADHHFEQAGFTILL
jgi:predicted nucleic acid-binding protein